MFLSGVLFVLFLAGCWLYCLTDAALTPASQFPGLSKRTWVAVIAVTFIAGAIAWVIARCLNRKRRAFNLFVSADAVARHPASRTRQTRAFPVGPDDDPEFLQMLDRLISGTSDPGELALPAGLRARWQKPPPYRARNPAPSPGGRPPYPPLGCAPDGKNRHHTGRAGQRVSSRRRRSAGP